MGTAVFQKIGECVPVEQLIATGMENKTNFNNALFGAGTFKRGQLVKLTKGVASAYDPEAAFAAGERFAIVKDDFTVEAAKEKETQQQEKHLVYVTGSFYRDTVEAIADKTISLADELEMNAEGIYFNMHL